MSAAILAEAEAMESRARALANDLYMHASWEDRMRAEDRIEELREDAANIRARIASSREHIRNYYGLDLRIELDVTHGGRPGRIVGFRVTGGSVAPCPGRREAGHDGKPVGLPVADLGRATAGPSGQAGPGHGRPGGDRLAGVSTAPLL